MHFLRCFVTSLELVKMVLNSLNPFLYFQMFPSSGCCCQEKRTVVGRVHKTSQ